MCSVHPNYIGHVYPKLADITIKVLKTTHKHTSITRLIYVSDHCIMYIQSSTVITRYNLSDITRSKAITTTENNSESRIKTDTPYLALTGELWGFCCEHFRNNWPRYNGTALFMISIQMYMYIRGSVVHLCILKPSRTSMWVHMSELLIALSHQQSWCWLQTHVYLKVSLVIDDSMQSSTKSYGSSRLSYELLSTTAARIRRFC